MQYHRRFLNTQAWKMIKVFCRLLEDSCNLQATYQVRPNLLHSIPCVKRRSRCRQRDSILALRVPPLLYRRHTAHVTTSTSVVTDLYPHMPILRPHAARYFANGASLAWRLRRRIPTVRWPIRQILAFWGSKIHKNVWFPALDADVPPRKLWRR